MRAMCAATLTILAGVSACLPERLVAMSEAQSGGTSNSSQAAGAYAIGGSAPAGGTSACGTLDGSCSEPADCCSGICGNTPHGRACLMPPACRKALDPCSNGSDCCAGACGSDGLCPAAIGCNLIGEPCGASSECCSGACSNLGTGTKSCQAIDGCRPVGEVCSRGPECCSQYCTFDAAAGYSHCTIAPNCAPAGEVCVDGQTDIQCCSAMGGPMSPAEACLETLEGVGRCQAPGARRGSCLADNSRCHFGAECCGRYCQPNQAGDLVCAGACLLDQGNTPCLSSRDCCAGACVNATCQLTGVVCNQLGQRCTLNQDCCSGVCTAGAAGGPSHCVP